MVALALPFVVEVAGEIAARIACRFLFFRVVEAGFVVELPGLPVIKKRECHNRIILLETMEFF